jgi:hypothetical protein
MRKMREQDVKFVESAYCFNNGVGLKKKSKEIYPLLEKKCKQITNLKNENEKQLITEMQILINLLKTKKISGGELDLRVNEQLREYELTQE